MIYIKLKLYQQIRSSFHTRLILLFIIHESQSFNASVNASYPESENVYID